VATKNFTVFGSWGVVSGCGRECRSTADLTYASFWTRISPTWCHHRCINAT